MSGNLPPIRIIIAGVDNFSKEFKHVTALANKISSGMKNTGQAMTSRITLPLTLLGGAILKSGYEFDKMINTVESKSDIGSKSIKDLRDQAKDLGRTTSFSHIQAAEGMMYLAQAGLNTDKVFKTIVPTLKLARATSSDLGNTADWLTNIMGGIRAPIEDVNKVANTLALVTAKSNVNLEQLFESLKNTTSLATTFGVSLKDQVAILGFLGNIGIQGTLAGTAMKNVYANIISSTPAAKKAWDFLKIDPTDGKGNFRDIKEIMLDISKAVPKVSQVEGLAAINEIFGLRAIAGANALVGDLADTNSNFEYLVKTLDNMPTDVLEKMYGIQTKGNVGVFERFKSAIQGLGQTIADSGFMDQVTTVVIKLTNMLDIIDKMNPNTIRLATNFAMLAAAAGPVVFIAGALIGVVTKSVIGFQMLKNVLTKAGGVIPALKAFGSVAKKAFLPAFLLIGAVKIGIRIFKEWRAHGENMFGGKLKYFFDKVVPLMKSAFYTLKESVAGLLEKLGFSTKELEGFGDPLIAAGVLSIGSAFTVVVGIVTTLVDILSKAVELFNTLSGSIGSKAVNRWTAPYIAETNKQVGRGPSPFFKNADELKLEYAREQRKKASGMGTYQQSELLINFKNAPAWMQATLNGNSTSKTTDTGFSLGGGYY